VTPVAELAGVQARLERALAELYRWYGQTEAMLANVTRDAEVLPGLVGRGYAEMLVRLRDALIPGWQAENARARLLQAALGHAIHFRTWRSLVRDQGLDPAQAVGLMVDLVRSAAGR